jgi:hypothetical protein
MRTFPTVKDESDQFGSLASLFETDRLGVIADRFQ